MTVIFIRNHTVLCKTVVPLHKYECFCMTAKHFVPKSCDRQNSVCHPSVSLCQSVYQYVLCLLFCFCQFLLAIAIPGFQITGSRPFSPFWRHPNLGITKICKNHIFWALNDKITILEVSWIKCFLYAKVLLFAVLCNLYFDSHSHSLYHSDILSIRLHHILCME